MLQTNIAVKNKLEYFLFISLGKLFSVFGFKNARYFAKYLAFLFYYILKIRRTTVIENLKTAFPEYSEKEVQSLAFKNYFSFSLTLIELFSIKNLSRKDLFELVECGELIKIHSEGIFKNGGFFLTAHYGNWELGAISIGAQLNIEINVLAKPQRNKFVSDWLNSMRESSGNKTILLGTSVREVYKSINEKKVVGIVGDQRGPIEGKRVKYFGKETAVFQGTASIAFKKKAPIVVVFLERQENLFYKAKVDVIDYEKFNGTDDEIIHKINQEYMRLLEKQVRKKPEQWFWMHKIWKY